MAKSERGRKWASRHRAKQRATDFNAGIEVAYKQIGPVIMRRYFLRGMLAGAGVLAVVASVVVWGLHFTGAIVLELGVL